MSYSLHRGAAQDLTEALQFYRREAGIGLARRLLDEFERVIHLLEQFPDIGTLTGDDRRVYPLSGFPYSLIYRRVGAGIRVLVLRHQHRDPGHGDQRSY